MLRKYQLRMLQLIITVNIYTKEQQRNLITSLEDDNSPRLAHLNEDDGWFNTKRNDRHYDVVSVDKKKIYVVKKTYHRNKEPVAISLHHTVIPHKGKKSSFHCLDMGAQNIHAQRHIFDKILQL